MTVSQQPVSIISDWPLEAESRRSTLLCPMAAFTQDRSFTPTGGTGDVRSRTEQDAAFQKEGAALAAVTSLTASP